MVLQHQFGDFATERDMSNATNRLPTIEEVRRCQLWFSRLTPTTVRVLQQTSEFHDFWLAFQRLEHRHRQVDSFSILHEGNANIYAPPSIQMNTASVDFQRQCVPVIVLHENYLDDDILLRILEFLDASSLAHASKTCTRLYSLTNRCAERRSADMAVVRQLTNSVQLLRAKEQIQGIGLTLRDKYVPVPALLLHRRILVTGCGDPDYNGVFVCTGCNGNGFTFSKPRESNQQIQTIHHRRATARYLQSDDDSVAEDSLALSGVEVEPEVTGHVPLRCLIAKRFSNETILWYMSKEVVATENSEDDETVAGEVTQVYSFWAKLMLAGDASQDRCRYPSQTSCLLRHGEGWHSLSTANMIEPPVVELLDS